MIELTHQDLHFVLTRLPKDVQQLLRENRLFLGGGFIRETLTGGKPNDIDLFGPSAEVLSLAAQVLQAKRNARLHTTPNAITVLAPPRMPVQFIKRWLYAEAHKVVESFDFTVCQAVIWFADERWHSLVAETFYSDLAARRLTYTFPQREEAAGGSIMRVRKFLARGYNIQATSFAGVIARVASGVRGFDSLEERQRAKVIAGLLQEVDPLLVVDGVEIADEHEEKQALAEETEKITGGDS